MNLAKPASIPLRPLLALTGLMFLLHAAVLQLAPPSLSFDESPEPVRLLARGIVLPAPAQSQVPVTPAQTPATKAKGAPPDAPFDKSARAAAGEGLARVGPAALAVLDRAPAADTPNASVAPGTSAADSGAVQTSQEASAAAESTPAPSAAAVPQAKTAVLQIPDSARLKYRASAESQGISLSASGELHWRHDGRHYEARLSVGNFLRTRVQTSRGLLGIQGLMPIRFSDKSGSERAAHFERGPGGQGGHVVFSANSPSLALAPLAQDRLSVLLQLAAMLAGEPARFAQGAEFSLQVVGARDAEIWVFRVEVQELLELPIGSLQTLKLTRLARREYDQKVEVWLAQAMGYLPVRIRITEPNGNFVDQKLEKLETP